MKVYCKRLYNSFRYWKIDLHDVIGYFSVCNDFRVFELQLSHQTMMKLDFFYSHMELLAAYILHCFKNVITQGKQSIITNIICLMDSDRDFAGFKSALTIYSRRMSNKSFSYNAHIIKIKILGAGSFTALANFYLDCNICFIVVSHPELLWTEW